MLKTSLMTATILLAGIASAEAQSRRGCQTGQAITSDNYDAPATMTVKSGGYCNRQFTTTRFKLNEIQFVEMPKHGKLIKNGRFGYRYVAPKGFAGNDSFAVRYVGQKTIHDGRTNLAVYQGLRWTVNVVQ